jgi:lysozyme family protein
MASNFDPCVQFTLAQEGGYSDDPNDPGGATNFGITIAVLSAWRHTTCTPADVKALTQAEAEAIYGALYWNTICGESLPPGVDLMVFDGGVNTGVARAAMQLQAALAIDADGSIGPQTLAAAHEADVGKLITTLAMCQTAYYRGLGMPEYLNGWLARVVRREALATTMAGVAASAPDDPGSIAAPAPATPAAPDPPPTLLLPGMQGGMVSRMQTLLRDLGFYAGAIDGDYGPVTKESVAKFQQAHSLYIDGICGAQTWAALLAGGVT